MRERDDVSRLDTMHYTDPPFSRLSHVKFVDILSFASGFFLNFNTLRTMTSRRPRHIIGRLSILIVTFMIFRIALTVAIGVSSGNVTSGISNGEHCTDDYNWKGKDVRRQDCLAALGHLYRSEVVGYGDKDFEFLSARAIQRSADSMRTPRRYTVGECVNCSRFGSTLG